MSETLDYEINKELGECYLFMGDLEKAQEYYQKAASSNGVHPEPYLGLATIAVHQGDLDAALAYYNKAASTGPNDKALAGVGLIRMEQGGVEEAFSCFMQAMELNPENDIALFGMLQCGHALGRLCDTVPLLESRLSLDPLKSDVRYALAGCLASMGNNREAGEHLETLMEFEPGHEAARELYEQVTAV